MVNTITAELVPSYPASDPATTISNVQLQLGTEGTKGRRAASRCFSILSDCRVTGRGEAQRYKPTFNPSVERPLSASSSLSLATVIAFAFCGVSAILLLCREVNKGRPLDLEARLKHPRLLVK